MDERTFFDTAALLDTLVVSERAIGVAFDIPFLLRRLKNGDTDILNDAILRVLNESAFAADAEILPILLRRLVNNMDLVSGSADKHKTAILKR